MKKFTTVSHQKVCELICDGCGLQATTDKDFEFGEFISISQQCGYGSIHGDGKQVSVDLCQLHNNSSFDHQITSALITS